MVEVIVGATFFILGIVALGLVRERIRAKFLTGQPQEFAAVGSRDQVFDRVPLGVLPAGHGSAPTRPARRDEVRAPVAVRFDPPQGLLPEQTGMLRLAMTTSRDVAAAFTALIVAGHVAITRHQIFGAHGSVRSEWWLKTVRPPDDGELRIWLYEQITRLPAPHTLDAFRQVLHHHGPAARSRYAQTAQHRSWYPRRDQAGRSAEATALHYQLAGFRLFLETADGDRLRFEEGAGLFSRYLPWAVALDLTVGNLSTQLTAWDVVGDAASDFGSGGEFGGGDFWHGDFSGYASGYGGGS